MLKTKDIPGAQIATLKKGMTTIRHVNPLVPDYQNPGHSEPAPVYDRNTTQFKGSTQGKFKGRNSSMARTTGQNIVAPSGEVIFFR